MVGVFEKRVRPGERGLDVHIPIGADQLVEFLFAGGDALLHLPDQVAHEPGDIDRIFRGRAPGFSAKQPGGPAGLSGGEILYEPVFRLVVDKFVIVADTGFPEAFCE